MAHDIDDRDAQPILYLDSITIAGAAAVGRVIVSGSHGGLYPAYLAAKARARAVILNDAGIGRDKAGIGSLDYASAIGMAAATVSHTSCRIGDTRDMRARGVISYANAQAAAFGVEPAMTCAEAARRLIEAPLPRGDAPAHAEARHERTLAGTGRTIILVDSASLVGPTDRDRIIVTGSHGGLIGGDADKALKAPALVAAFNDAGGGADGAGYTRLPALERRAVAALTVSHDSARIGDAQSSFAHGVISRINESAGAMGARPGQALRAFLERI